MEITSSCNVVTSTANFSNENTFQVYPNQESFHYRTDQAIEYTIQVYNSAGQLLLSLKEVDQEGGISTADLSKGVYCVAFTHGTRRSVHKIVKL